jgi:hypothetical protein
MVSGSASIRVEQFGCADPGQLRRLSGFMLSVGIAGLVATAVTLASVPEHGSDGSPDRASATGQLASLDAEPAPVGPDGRGLFEERFNSSYGERRLPFDQRFGAPTELEDHFRPTLPRDSRAPAQTAKRQNPRQAMLAPAIPSKNKLTLPADKTADSILATLGPRTAIYDISARLVYLPNGESLEAHSGLGEHMDDLRSVSLKMRGVTPPNIYALSMRERRFHGVRALRLTPADPDAMFGRDGILAHSYLLGPNGDSNGCVSIKDYDRFLNAYLSGDIERIVVVDSLSAPPSPATAVGWLSQRVKALFGAS